MSNSNTLWREVSDPAALVKQPVVSVHMITYGHEQCLPDAIEGALRQQTGFPYEIVIGEDCSPDGTRTIALDYQRRYPDRIRVLMPANNVGGVRNFLHLITHCRGRYIAFCEGDDYWHDYAKVERQVNFLEHHSDHVLAHSDFDVRCGNRIEPAYYKRVGQPVPTGSVFEKMLVNSFVKTLTVCLRSEIAREFVASPFGKGQYPMCDYPLWLFAASRGLLGYFPESLATYRVIPGSITHSDCQSAVRLQLSLCQVAEDFISNCARLVAGHAEALRETGLKRVRALSLSGDRAAFLREYGLLRQRHPDWRPDDKMRLRYVLVKLHLGALLRAQFNLRIWRKHHRSR
jgi:glycosyltransferase involved in cell wall biosynthesis